MKGQIQISHPMGTRPDYIEIRLTDGVSNVQFAEVKIDTADFARALTGLLVGMDWTPRGLDRIGMRSEHKTEIVPRSCEYGFDEATRKAKAAADVAPYELDGWRARGAGEDLLNGHYQIRGTENAPYGGYRVTFFRHVPVAEASS